MTYTTEWLLKLQYDVNEKVELIKSLEEKLEQLNERFQMANDKCVEMDKEIQWDLIFIKLVI